MNEPARGQRWKWAAALLLFAGLALRGSLLHVHRLDTFQPTSDESQYLRLSSNLLHGRGLTEDREPPRASTLRARAILFLAGAGAVAGADVIASVCCNRSWTY